MVSRQQSWQPKYSNGSLGLGQGWQSLRVTFHGKQGGQGSVVESCCLLCLLQEMLGEGGSSAKVQTHSQAGGNQKPLTFRLLCTSCLPVNKTHDTRKEENGSWENCLTNPHYLQGLGEMAGIYLEMLKGVGRKKFQTYCCLNYYSKGQLLLNFRTYA